VKVGWSGEVLRNEWVKIDLDESDLAALCHEAGLDPDLRHLISPVLAYSLLDTECQRLMTAKLAECGGDKAEAKARLGELNDKRAGLMGALKHLGSADTGAPNS
jgi:hypothetical protein